jgi:hypothetical protein
MYQLVHASGVACSGKGFVTWVYALRVGKHCYRLPALLQQMVGYRSIAVGAALQRHAPVATVSAYTRIADLIRVMDVERARGLHYGPLHGFCAIGRARHIMTWS